jgi:signal transduction histidine kinase
MIENGYSKLKFKRTAENKDLYNFRWLLFICTILHVMMGYIRNKTEPNAIDPINVRIVISLYGFIFFCLSFINNYFKKNLRLFGYGFGYLISLNMFYVIVANHFIATYTIGIFLVLFGVSIIFKKIQGLIIYVTFMLIIAAISCNMVVNPQTNLKIFFSAFFCIGLIICLALSAKIKTSEELENLNILLFNEIADKEKAELTIKKLNAHLQENIHHLEIANSDLEAFSYSVSHDLRAPLRNIHSISNTLMQDYSNIDAKGKEMLKTLNNNTVSMDKLISNLLSFSLLGKHEIKKFTVDMTELAKDVLEEYCKSDAEMINTVKIHPMLVAQCDYTLIHHVFINLISNAFKYTATKSDRKIEIGSKQGINENIYFIKDNGVGFDTNYSKKLFEVFQRLHSSDDFEGFGVGLAIVKRIIDKHLGKVWAESVEGEGATFYFSIPDK